MITPNTYTSAGNYVRSATNLKERIEKVRQVIDALLDLSIDFAEGSHIDEYSVDTGQSKIRTKYRNPQELQNAIGAWVKMEDTLIARYNRQNNGSIITLVDRKSFYRK